ncbi:MAG: DUF4910 domain-containing protein, partial [Succinivibrio sp.]
CLPELKITEVPCGTKAFDWTVPDEWNCRDCYIEDQRGNRIIDIKNCNLHVLGYSETIDRWMDIDELEKYIYTLPNQKDAIPYITSYYSRRTGFCMSENQLNELKKQAHEHPQKYHAVIDSSFSKDGSLTYGECLIKGESSKEILISTYICHPSMANNECSGPALATVLADYIKSRPRKYTYRIVFIPETIGSIVYLSKHLEELKRNTIAGFVLSCVGDDRDYSFVKTRYGNTITDRVLENTLKGYTASHKAYSFLHRGSDERQYNAPGVDLPVCSFSRTKYGMYKEYHTSLDNLSLISEAGFEGAFSIISKAIEVLENNGKYRIKVLCEPQLGKRDLYPTLSKKDAYSISVMAMRNFIAYADGLNDLLDISSLIGVPAFELISIKDTLLENDLLEEVL